MTDKLTFVPQSKNVNKHTSYGLRLLEKSVQGDGWLDAQTAAADGEIISGSARIELAGEKFADVEPIIVHSDGTRPVIVVRDDIPNANSPRARRLSVAANKIAQVDFDPDWALLKEWGGEDEQIKKLFSDDEWREGTGEEAPQVDAPAEIDRAAELQEKWQTSTGQLWRLGDHRLLIGDCTVRENVERLMGGERASICFTSPPYGNARDYELGEFDFMGLYNQFSEIAFSYCEDVLVNLGLIHKDGAVFRYWEPWLDYCKSIGNELFGWYVWDQGAGMPGDFHGRLARSHEWIFHFSKSHKNANKWIKTSGESLKRGVTGKRFRQKDGSLKELGSPDTIGQPYKVPDSVVRIGREMARGVHTENHPAVFPVEFPEFGIKTWSNDNDIVYEPFGGSGTTIIAAHNLNRRCFAMEISEKYGAVILERFFTATGITPELVE